MYLDESIDVSDGNYVMGVTSLNMYSSIFNITNKNDKLVYNNGTDLLWNEIVFPYGAYEITQLNDEIIRQLFLELDFQMLMTVQLNWKPIITTPSPPQNIVSSGFLDSQFWYQ